MDLTWIVVVAMFGLPHDSSGQHISTPDETVWSWRGTCQSPQTMRLRVTYKEKIVYRGSFAVCHSKRRDLPANTRQRIVKFGFRADQRDFGREFTARARQVEGNIWEAGADPKAVLLGLSISTPDRVLLKTIHRATPGKASRSVPARHLVVTTSLSASR